MTETAAAPAPAAPAAESPASAPPAPAAAPVVAAPAAEVAYALVAPQGSNYDASHIAAATEAYKAAGVKPDAAQVLLNREWSQRAAWDESNKTGLSTQSKEWRKGNEADPDYGGQKLAESDAAVKSILTRFAPEGFEAALRESGLINAPGLHRLLVNASRALGEKPAVQPPQPTPSTSETSPVFDSQDWKAFMASRK